MFVMLDHTRDDIAANDTVTHGSVSFVYRLRSKSAKRMRGVGYMLSARVNKYSGMRVKTDTT
jgi:hypothetical protein